MSTDESEQSGGGVAQEEFNLGLDGSVQLVIQPVQCAGYDSAETKTELLLEAGGLSVSVQLTKETVEDIQHALSQVKNY